MPLPGRERTFAFESCKDMLSKLAWEADNLERHVREGGDIATATYWATNGAITAWHVVDWIWEDMDLTQRSALSLKLDVPLRDLSDMAGYVDKTAELHACRAIALTSKHSVLQPKSAIRFEKVEAEVSLGPTFAISVMGVTVQHAPSIPYSLIVKVDGVTTDALSMLRAASSYWESFVRKNGIVAAY
jgi:hypothetical protein